MRLLITGASGLVGAKLTETATRAGHEVFPLYNQHSIKSHNATRADIKQVQDITEILRKSSPDVVVHLASITDVDFCEQNPQLALSVNGTATGILAEECLRIRSHLLYVSTDYVFDGQQGNYKEEDLSNPVNTYGRSKLMGEEAARKTSESFCVARTSVVYGWGREFRPNLATWLYAELSAGRSVKTVADQYASPTLNSHLANMLLEVAERRLSGTFHLAGSSRLSRYEFAHKMARELRMDTRLIIPTNSKSASWVAERPPDSSLNVEKAQKLLTHKPVAIDRALVEFAAEAGN